MADISGGKHRIQLEGRERMLVSGVEDVLNFDESGVVLKTVAGVLSVDGTELRITSLNVESGDVEIEGNVNGIIYPQSQTKRVGLFRRGG